LAAALAAGLVASGVGAAIPAAASAFNPQPDPPHVSLDLGVAGLGSCTINLGTTGTTAAPTSAISLTVPTLFTYEEIASGPLGVLLPPDVCAPAPPTSG
jgi:hypothetical protein